MSKIQEFIDAWNTEVDVKIATAQSDVDAYLAARQTAIALTDPFILKMPKMKVFGISEDFTIDGFDVTTLGQLFDWSYPASGPKNYSVKYINYKENPEIVEEYVDRKLDVNDNLITPTSLYTEGYTYATMSYLAEQYETGLGTRQDLYNILKIKSSGFLNLESYKKLKNLGGKAWFDVLMRSLYYTIFNTKISVSNLKYKDYSSIINSENFDESFKEFLPNYYNSGFGFPLGTGEQSKYFQAVLEAGDGFFPSQTSGTQSGTQSGVNTDYTLSVINPLSDIEKKIQGKIVFIEAGNYIIPNSTLNGLPNPWTNPKTNVVVPNNTGTITFNGGKSTSSKNNLATDAIIALQNIIEGTYGLTIYLKYTEPDGPPVVPPGDITTGSSASNIEGSSASTITGASESSIPGATVSTIGTQEFTFNVEQLDIFSNADFGNLFIIGQEDETLLYDDGTDTYGSEYVEDEFAGQDEFAVEGFTQEELQALPRSTDLPPDSKDDTKEPSNPVTPIKVNIPGDSWYAIAANFIAAEEGFLSKAKWDIDHYRGGFGTSQKLVGSNLVEVTASTTFTKQEATDTLAYQIKNQYEKIMISAFGAGPWSKLNKNQKAAVLSLAYNCGAYIYTAKAVKTRSYAKTVKQGVLDNNASLISKGIASGPTTGGGKVYAALVRRRAKESGLALA
jgi:GH24 family phage-related lysozyme (muramidase)